MLLKSSAEPVKHFISFLSGPPLSLPLIEMSRGQRQQSGPPVTSVPALSSHQLVWLPTRWTVSLPFLAFAPKSSTFVLQGISRPRASTRPTVVSACPAVPIQSLRGHHWVTRLLTFKDTSQFRFLPTSETRRSHSQWYT